MNDSHSPVSSSFQQERKPLREKAAAQTSSVDAVRALVDELRQLGLDDPVEALREGTVAMGGRCVSAFHRRGGRVGVGWLYAAIKEGGSWASVQPRDGDGYEALRAERAAGLREVAAEAGLEL